MSDFQGTSGRKARTSDSGMYEVTNVNPRYIPLNTIVLMDVAEPAYFSEPITGVVTDYSVIQGQLMYRILTDFGSYVWAARSELSVIKRYAGGSDAAQEVANDF